NAFCNSYDVDVNDLFVFDDVSIRKSQVSKMSLRKKPSASLNVPSRRKSLKYLPRIVRKWLPTMKLFAEPVAKWIPRIVQICLWIIDSGCSKHMTGNHALLTNFVEKFLGTVRFRNNDFAVIVGYGDVIIGSMMIKKVYYVEGLVHNLFSVGKFCDKGLEVAFRKSACCVRNENGVDLLTGDRSSNLYTIPLNGIASNSSSCLLAKASSLQSWLWHQLVVDDFSRYTWVFFLHSKDEASEVIISFIKKTQVNLQLQVQRIRTDNGTEFKNKTLAMFFDEVGIFNNFLLQERHNKMRVHHTMCKNERLKDAYFDASTTFHDTFDVQIYYQPYPNETKWTKDHPLHKIIGDPKPSVRIRGQLANSCLFACLLSSIEPANVDEALKDADWVIAMQDELDQFARLKVWRLVSKPEGKTVIKIKWIFKNKKDESSFVTTGNFRNFK
nr:hypothetical protein [Tanacetum cinerariifolium]